VRFQSSFTRFTHLGFTYHAVVILQARFQEMMQAQLAAQDAAHQQNLEAVAGHYQR
jgi:hypothetical protein